MTSTVTLLSNISRLEGFIATGKEALQSNNKPELFGSALNIIICLRNFGFTDTYEDSFVFLDEMNANKDEIEKAGKHYLGLCRFVKLSMDRIITEINPEEV